MAADLTIASEELEHKVILRLSGRLDAASFSILEKKLNHHIQHNDKNILLDFQKIEYLSSAGMRLLLSFTKRLKADGGALVIFGLLPEIMEIIKMAGFERILQICRHEKDALLLF